MATFRWPDGFERIPAQPWVSSPLETLALKYDTVEGHGWYRNLEPTLDQLQAYLRDGHVLVDYSGGTGILVDRLLQRVPDLQAGFVIVDASPKFLRLALEKLGADSRLAFRWIRYLRDDKRLERVDEVLPAPFRADAVVSTNAIHLYYDLAETLAAWTRILRPGARAFVQSGNIKNAAAPADDWIIDDTVHAIHAAALQIVAADNAFAAYRPALADPARMATYDALRRKYFLDVRPLSAYLQALGDAGFESCGAEYRSIEASVDDWYDFLSVYHEGVLGWVGGTEKIDGVAPSADAVTDRKALIRAAMDSLFGGGTFTAGWTYITATAPAT